MKPHKEITENDLNGRLKKAAKKAEDYINDNSKLTKLFEDARDKISKIDKGLLEETWAQLLAMIRLIRAYADGSYREIPWTSLALIVGAVIYFVSPIDLIPDFLPGGFIDDAGVIAIALRSVKGDLEQFMAWEIAPKKSA